jgi:hypothetical protein
MERPPPTSRVRGHQRLGEETGALAGYLAVAIGVTYPLVWRLGAAFPGSGTDVFGFLWNNWWIHYAITHHLAKPYLTTYIFAPFRLDLRLHTVGFLYGLLSAPFFAILGQVRVLNLQILATITLNGYFTYRLVRRLTGDRAVALLCGLLATSMNGINFHIGPGRPSCSAFWTAIAVLTCFLDLDEDPRPATIAVGATSLVAMFLADQQVALYGSMWLVLLAASRFLRRGGWARLRRLAPAMLVLASAGLAAAYVLYLRPWKYDLGYDVPGAVEALHYSDRPEHYLHFGLFWTFYGVVLPIAMPIVLARLVRVREAIPWALGAVFFYLLTFGPVLSGTHLPMPFALLRHLPGLENFRTPYRFRMPAVFGAIVALGLVLRATTARLGPRARAAVIAALGLVTIADAARLKWQRPFLLREMPVEPVYAEIGRDPVLSVLLEVPVGVRNGTDRIGVDGEILTYYQPTHGKRLVNGFVARSPLAAIDYYRHSPAFMYLAGEIPLSGDLTADLRQKIEELGVGYIVVHPNMMKPERVAPTLRLLATLPGLTPIAASPELVAFRREGATIVR